MANYLDAHPAERIVIEGHRSQPRPLIPLVANGTLAQMVSPRVLDWKPSSPLSAEDYVVGLEVLGFRFIVSREGGERTLREVTPILDSTPDSWLQLAATIRAAYRPDDMQAVAEFVLARDGETQ